MRVTPNELSKNQISILEQVGRGVSGFGVEDLADIRDLESLGLISVLKVHRFRDPSAERSEWVLVSPADREESA